MSDKHTGPYVPEALYSCHDCREECSWPAKDLHWNPVLGDWICGECGSYEGAWEDENGKNCRPENPLSLADHLKSMEPRWVPVSERLPEFGGGGTWEGLAIRHGNSEWQTWIPGQFKSGIITHWLDFKPPHLPGEEKQS